MHHNFKVNAYDRQEIEVEETYSERVNKMVAREAETTIAECLCRKDSTVNKIRTGAMCDYSCVCISNTYQTSVGHKQLTRLLSPRHRAPAVNQYSTHRLSPFIYADYNRAAE